MPGPAHLVRALRPGREADDVAAAQHPLPVGVAQRRRPREHDQPLLDRVVEVERVRPLAVGELVDRWRRSARRRSPSRPSRRASGSRRAPRSGRTPARRRSSAPRPAAYSRPSAAGEAAQVGEPPGDLRMAALAVDAARRCIPTARAPSMSSCERVADHHRLAGRRPRAARAAPGRSTRAASSSRARAT